MEMMVYRTEFTNEAVFRKLEEKIQQVFFFCSLLSYISSFVCRRKLCIFVCKLCRWMLQLTTYLSCYISTIFALWYKFWLAAVTRCQSLAIINRLLDSLVVECWHRVWEFTGSIPSKGPSHTNDVIKMVPEVPLFSTQHWEGKY